MCIYIYICYFAGGSREWGSDPFFYHEQSSQSAIPYGTRWRSFHIYVSVYVSLHISKYVHIYINVLLQIHIYIILKSSLMNISVYRCYIYIYIYLNVYMYIPIPAEHPRASEATQHPDRRPNDPDAVVKFMRIKKENGKSMGDNGEVKMMVKCWVNGK